MNKEIIEFYESKNLHLSKMIDRRPAGITPEQVRGAAEKVYREIKEGRQIKDIRIAWEVWAAAKQINADRGQKESLDVLELQARNADLSGQLIHSYLLTGVIIVAWIFLEVLRWI